MSAPVLPPFAQELGATLAVHAHYVLHSNVHDEFIVRRADGTAELVPLEELLLEVLLAEGYDGLVVLDATQGARLLADDATDAEAHRARSALYDAVDLLLGGDLAQGKKLTRERIAEHIAALTTPAATSRVGVLIGGASRLVLDPSHLEEAEHAFFVTCEHLARSAHRVSVGGRRARYRPVVWLVERENDLPAWFAADNEKIRQIGIPRPGLADRHEAAQQLLEGLGTPGRPVREEDHDAFAAESDGLTLTAMEEVVRLAGGRGAGVEDLPDAVRTYKLGVVESPWRQRHLRRRIAAGEQTVATRVMGQEPAVQKTLDILKRAALGLSGAQASSSPTRPRGVLFFAGPTGVGKTELAKTIASMVFGDESAYLRFDMSEFASEQAGERLIGAPPGYVGFEAGGELTNAVRQQPFRVVLFDEIEKGHHRILDKFLQILEDGRLTDGRGITTYFSECILVFTSNLGTVVDDGTGNRVANISPDDPWETIESRVRAAIEHHFVAELKRPELLNRFGDNIVVFGFITPDVANRIFEGQLDNIVRRVAAEHGIVLEVAAPAREHLRARCTADPSRGGRGVGSALESWFVNPLARALFDEDRPAGSTVYVQRVVDDGPVVRLELT